MGVLVQLAVSAEVKETAGGIIRAGSEGLGVGEELNSIDI